MIKFSFIFILIFVAFVMMSEIAYLWVIPPYMPTKFQVFLMGVYVCVPGILYQFIIFRVSTHPCLVCTMAMYNKTVAASNEEKSKLMNRFVEMKRHCSSSK